MRRREFITLLGGAVVALPLAALAQKAGRTYRLGCLSPHPRDILNVHFFDKLRRAGFVEGQNLTIDYRAFAPRLDLISQYAAELVIAQPDVIYAASGAAIHAVQQATKSIPIVGIAGDMVREGGIESFTRPNGNTTGISIFAVGGSAGFALGPVIATASLLFWGVKGTTPAKRPPRTFRPARMLAGSAVAALLTLTAGLTPALTNAVARPFAASAQVDRDLQGLTSGSAQVIVQMQPDPDPLSLPTPSTSPPASQEPVKACRHDTSP